MKNKVIYICFIFMLIPGFLFSQEETDKIKKDSTVLNPEIIINIGLPKLLYYDVKSDSLNSISRSYLDKLSEYLKTGNYLAKIEAHTDNRGTIQELLSRSSTMASRVKDYLIMKGVKIEYLTLKSFGGRNPLVSNTTPTNRARNNRVNIILYRK